MCSAAELSNKKKFPTFSRTFAVDNQVAPSIISLLKYTYNWTRVAIIVQNTTKWMDLKDYLVEEFEKERIDVAMEYTTVNPVLYDSKHEAQFRDALEKLKRKARSKSFDSWLVESGVTLVLISLLLGSRCSQIIVLCFWGFLRVQKNDHPLQKLLTVEQILLVDKTGN